MIGSLVDATTLGRMPVLSFIAFENGHKRIKHCVDRSRTRRGVTVAGAPKGGNGQFEFFVNTVPTGFEASTGLERVGRGRLLGSD